MTDEPTSQHAAIDAKVREIQAILGPEDESLRVDDKALICVVWMLVVICIIYAALTIAQLQ